MSTQPLVSIITPSYNQAAFLEDTIQSVLQQDYQPLEYIIVDGASNDGSVEIIKCYSERLSWWISESDAGQAEAINKGLKRASGEIIAWLNSDDIYLPGAVRQAVEKMKANPDIVMVFSDAVTIDKHGSPLNFLRFEDWGLLDLVAFRIICQPAVFIRREFLLQAGLLEPSYHSLLDHNLWVRIARLGQIQHACPEYKTFENPESGQFKGLWAAARHHPDAKNVAQPTAFAEEANHLLDWMEGQPDLIQLIQGNQGKVYSGAFRLSGRYLLDGGQPKVALGSYWKAFNADPRYTLKHLNRILYALVCVIAGEKLAEQIMGYTRRSKSITDRLPGLKGWPKPSNPKKGKIN